MQGTISQIPYKKTESRHALSLLILFTITPVAPYPIIIPFY